MKSKSPMLDKAMASLKRDGLLPRPCVRCRALLKALQECVAASDAFVADTGMKNSDRITDAADKARALIAGAT